MTNPMNDLLIGALWNDATNSIKVRLDTATMRSFCNPAGPAKSCVYVAGIDDFSAAEGPESEDWGRIVVAPIQTLWPVEERAGTTRKLGILVRSEFNNLSDPGYKPMLGLEFTQREAYRRLAAWTPGAASFAAVLVAFPFYRERAPQGIPQRDDARGIVFLSSEFRTEVSGKA